jgi:hypothetical protein
MAEFCTLKINVTVNIKKNSKSSLKFAPNTAITTVLIVLVVHKLRVCMYMKTKYLNSICQQ